MGWGYLDVETLERYVKDLEKVGGDIEDAKEFVEDIGADNTEINHWFYAVIDRIFYLVLDKAREEVEKIESEDEKEDLKSKLKDLEDNFSPYTNYMDSWFNNCLDGIDFERDDYVEQLIKLLKEDKN